VRSTYIFIGHSMDIDIHHLPSDATSINSLKRF